MNSGKSTPSDFDIPPTPARLGAVQRSNEICDLLNEEQYVDEASLSTLTGEVLEAQRYQLSELDTKQAMLHDLEVERKKSQQMYQTVFNEVKTMNRQLYLVQDNVDEAKKDCAKLENDIVGILSEKRKLQTQLVDTRWKGKLHLMSFEKYRNKMRAYKGVVEGYGKESVVNTELQNINCEIEALKIKLTNRSSEVNNVENTCEELRSEIKALTELQTTVDTEMKTLKLHVKKDRDHLFVLKKENEAVQKRDASKTKRLKVQIIQTERHNDEWREQNNTLLQRLQHLRK